jgi:serine phosphatase RsbU (regulator of sigma subunit)
MEDVQVDELPIRTGDVILIASDGVSEVSNEEGVQLGDTELYQNTIKKAATGSAQEMVDAVSSLVLRYVGDKKLRDDVTMLVAKVGKLWD